MSKNYAIVENGVVVNIAVSDRPLAPNWIESDVAQLHWTYDGAKFKPVFRHRFLPNEYLAIYAAVDAGDVDVGNFMKLINSHEYAFVNVLKPTDQIAINGINMLVSKGLLTQSRANEILTP